MISTTPHTANSVARNANMRAIRGVARTSEGRAAGERSSSTYSTYTFNRHSHPSPDPITATSVDYIDIGGRIKWDHSTPLPELADALARAYRTRRVVDLIIGGYEVALHRPRAGDHHLNDNAKDSYMEYVLTWQGVKVGLSPRQSTTRQLYNHKLIASGQPCTILGLPAIQKFQAEIISALGGEIIDGWFKRIDVCLDIAHKPLMTILLSSMREGRYITSSRTPIAFYPTCFEIASQGIRLRVYEKLTAMQIHKHNDAYRAAMRRRSGGAEPQHATRVEYQLRKEWLDALNLDTVPRVLARLHEVVAACTADGPRSFFRMTKKYPDAKNGNHSRAKTDPVWEWIISAMREGSSDIMSPPVRVKKRKPRP